MNGATEGSPRASRDLPSTTGTANDAVNAPGAGYSVLPGGDSTYVYSDAGITSGDEYYYAVSAQDCTPSLSSQRTSNMVTIP